MEPETEYLMRQIAEEAAEEEGMEIDRIRFLTDNQGLQERMIMEKKVAPGKSFKQQIAVSPRAEIEVSDPDYDPVLHEVEHHVQGMKDRLTSRFKVNGHDIFFYPYDGGEVMCPRCRKDFVEGGLPEDVRKISENEDKMKMWIIGFASKHNCNDLMDYQRLDTRYDS